MSLCSLLAGSGQEDELGHEKDVLPVEGPGAGGDQHCSSLQLPGSAGVLAIKPQEGTKPFRALEQKVQEPSLPGTTFGEICPPARSTAHHAYLPLRVGLECGRLRRR